MKINIIPPITNTGEGKYAKHVIEGIKQKDAEVNVLDSPFLHNPNIRVFLGSFLLNKIVDDEPSILHNLDNLGPFLVRSTTKIKNVLTVHDIAPIKLPQIHNNLMKFNFKHILPKLVKNSDLIIADSYSTKKDLESLFGVTEEKIEVAYLGVDLSFFYPRGNNEDILNKYGITKSYLLYVGNDNPRKNLKTLILAYSKVYKEIDHNLVLVGPINQNNLRTFINKIDNGNSLSKRIITPGYVDYKDLPLLYSKASALVFTSLYEGFGFAPLEAMACGTPAIVPNNSSIPEVVGEAGLYITDPLNPEEISNNIHTLLNDDKLQQKMINKGFKQSKKFTWENNINRTFEAYEKAY